MSGSVEKAPLLEAAANDMLQQSLSSVFNDARFKPNQYTICGPKSGGPEAAKAVTAI